MVKAITPIINSIKYNNPKYGWKDISIEFNEYPEYINKPYTVCGENLLTKHDYNITKLVVAISNKLNKIFGNVSDDRIDSAETVNLNGTNEVHIETFSLK